MEYNKELLDYQGVVFALLNTSKTHSQIFFEHLYFLTVRARYHLMDRRSRYMWHLQDNGV